MFHLPDNKWARLLAYVTGLVNQSETTKATAIFSCSLPRAHQRWQVAGASLP
jgi:hypothetical protein